MIPPDAVPPQAPAIDLIALPMVANGARVLPAIPDASEPIVGETYLSARGKVMPPLLIIKDI